MNKLMFFAAILLLFSCTDVSDIQGEMDSLEVLNSKIDSLDNPNARISTNPIPSYTLNWESISYMPHPSLSIRVPWQAGISSKISNDILQDYKKVDGWELAYSTFSNTTAEETLFFALYNKFRGILRLYYYSKNDISTYNSTYMLGEIELEGSQNNTSPVLNYVSQAIIDPTINLTSATNLVPFTASPNSWYVFEYELAYDPNMATKSFSDLSARFNLKGVNITNVNTDGNASGSLTGTISGAGNSLSINPNFSSSSTNYINSIIVNGEADANKLNVLTIIKNGIKSALTSGLSGLAKNFLSGIFSKTSTNQNTSKMMVDIQMSTTGTLQSTFGIPSPNIPFTGTLNAGGGNSYTTVPGVYRLTGKPTIKITKIHQRKINEMGEEIEPDIYYSYEVVPGTVNIQWNTAIYPNSGSVTNLKTNEVIVPVVSGLPIVTGNLEKTGSNSIASGTLVKNRYSMIDPLGVRVSFKFNPSNGSPSVLNVKTYKYNTTYAEVYLPPSGGGGSDS